MSYPGFQEYPKMLYRRTRKDTAAQNITHGVAWSIVNSAQEEKKASGSGWGSLAGAQRQQRRYDTFMAPVRFYKAHWRWFWSVVLAPAAGTAVTQVFKHLWP